VQIFYTALERHPLLFSSPLAENKCNVTVSKATYYSSWFRQK